MNLILTNNKISSKINHSNSNNNFSFNNNNNYNTNNNNSLNNNMLLTNINPPNLNNQYNKELIASNPLYLETLYIKEIHFSKERDP
jgi:hypothetical protein